MELVQLFTGLVVLVCAIHLAAMVGRTVFAASARNVLEEPARLPQPRSDWYCFFACSELTGSAPIAREMTQESVQEQQTVYATRQSKRRSRASMIY